MTSVLQQFLLKNSINPSSYLPIVHTSESYIISKCMESGRLRTSPCDVFGENILYFFVGRPSYKKLASEESEFWELPSCVVFDFSLSSAKRIYPFDTGAFRKRKYPSFINMMRMEDFEIDVSESSVKRAIGAFFQDNRSYFRLLPRSEADFFGRLDVDATDAEIQALFKLIRSRSSTFDDRRFSLEIQYDRDFEFSERVPIYCVVPEVYIESEKFMRWIDGYKINLDTYPVYPLRKDYYYSTIYEKVENFYRNNGFYEV